MFQEVGGCPVEPVMKLKESVRILQKNHGQVKGVKGWGLRIG